MPKISIIVVSYETRDLLRECLASLGDAHQVIVVDNASTDGSADMVAAEFPHMQLLRMPRNVGFGAGNNRGMESAHGDLVLLLNSDARAEPGSIEQLAEVFGDETVVAAGGRLLNPDGSVQRSCAGPLTLWALFCEQTYLERLFPRFRLLSPYWLTERLPDDRPSDVAQVMGACLMMRPVERFDDRFFLYCEDTELCRRLSRHGRILYVPNAVFRHELGGSSRQERWRAVARYNRGKELYFAIHQGRPTAVIAFLMNRLGALLRLGVWTLATLLTLCAWRSSRARMALFGRVLFAPVVPDRAR
ncbi:MAG TPA: glycosyltransferase family 2 protein [Fimbriimonadaceae bacterium]|nr:glycosyltransferase family 2 protein [Fimbriimonadaceae bacterium]HRJ95722.1 glycosyltransferase family 2 protein [Fimbriimonadaceae bacterium]